MLFDARPAELPVAELRSRRWAASLRSRLRGKLLARWQWIRPRLLPLAVATAGAFALLGSAEYLSSLARDMPATSEPTITIVIPPLVGAAVMVDAKPTDPWAYDDSPSLNLATDRHHRQR